MKKILLHNGNNNIVKAINKFLVKNLDSDKTNILFNSWHGQLFNVYQKHKPDIMLWPSSEYTQEFHDFVTDHHTDIKIFLIVDVPITQPEVNLFINNTSVKIIKNKNYTFSYINTVAEYGSLYDHEIFMDQQLQRNNKIIAILSSNNEKNHQLLDDVIYPNQYPVVVVNNPEFKSVVNLGVINYNDLAFIMNTYTQIIDIDNLFALEASACNIQNIDISDKNVANAIDNKIIKTPIANLDAHTYDRFVTQHIIPHFGI